jgi:hypothetical protein
MRKASEYYQRAQECRGLASRASDPDHKSMLASMAETWETLAQQREALLARKARIAALEPQRSAEVEP